MPRSAGLLLILLFAVEAAGQLLATGNLIVTTFDSPSPTTLISSMLVYGRDGSFKGEFAVGSTFREALATQEGLLVGTFSEIQRFDALGSRLPDFNTLNAAVYLVRARDGSIAGSNGSGELFVLAPDGALRTFRSTVLLNEPGAHGVDLAPDQCSLYSTTARSVAVWNLCDNTSPRQIGTLRPAPGGTGLRLLADGSILITYLTDVARLDASGNVIRTYGVPGRGLALDIDRTSFWTTAGGTLVKVDIESGAILQLIHTGQSVNFLSIVGEPRVALTVGTDVPALSPWILTLLAVALGLLAFVKLR